MRYAAFQVYRGAKYFPDWVGSVLVGNESDEVGSSMSEFLQAVRIGADRAVHLEPHQPVWYPLTRVNIRIFSHVAHLLYGKPFFLFMWRTSLYQTFLSAC